MTAKLTDREQWRQELSSAAPPADVMADLVFSLILRREAAAPDLPPGQGPPPRLSRHVWRKAARLSSIAGFSKGPSETAW
jgi:hypothetical protein